MTGDEQKTNFAGCIDQFTVEDELVHWQEYYAGGRNVENCPDELEMSERIRKFFSQLL